jgi:hypothetical protein
MCEMNLNKNTMTLKKIGLKNKTLKIWNVICYKSVNIEC